MSLSPMKPKNNKKIHYWIPSQLRGMRPGRTVVTAEWARRQAVE
jgi:hypothetical protein